MKKPSMREIAQRLGTSAVTVSKALGGKPGMSQALRERIWQEARAMGYPLPENGHGEESHLDIGILIPDRFLEKDSFYSVMYKKLVRRLMEDGHYALLELVTPESEQALVLPSIIQTRHVDGLILLGQCAKSYYRMIGQQDIPTLFLDFYDEQATADAVVGDNTYGCYRLTSHLIHNGHTQIGFVGNRRATSSIMDRFLGYYRAMLLHNLPVHEEWVIQDREDSGDMIPLVLPQPLPTAFVCNCDVVARKLILALKERDIRVPEDISVTGFDDFEIGEAEAPLLSTFRIDQEAMVELAVKTLSDRCRGDGRAIGRTVVGGIPIYRNSEQKRQKEGKL